MKSLETTVRNALAASLVCAAIASTAWAQDAATLIDQTLVGNHRSDANKARDQYRHPKETLLFFGLKPNMTVVEVWPSAGWWTEILAPVLQDQGKYYAAWYATQFKGAPAVLKEREKGFDAMLAGNPGLYGKVVKTALMAPEYVDIAPRGSADMVLTFRNVHNWAALGEEAVLQVFKSVHAVLKPGGVLGVVDHRLPTSQVQDAKASSGYVHQAYVTRLALAAGFRLAGASEINANPKDSADHPGGVWALPPTYGNKDRDRTRFEAVGESDRFTLKFVKP